MLQHDVYFYLKPDTTKEQKGAFKEGLKTLLTIEILEKGNLGYPADTAERPVVDKSYDFALYTTFKSVEDHDAYQDHPTHQKFLENFKQLFERVRVMDSYLFQ